MTHLIIQGVAKIEKEQASSSKTSLHQEVLHHSHMCAEKLRHFCKQQVVLDTIGAYLHDPRKTLKPFVVYGAPGCGKSVLMAAVARKIKTWFGHNTVVVMRFLGTSSGSSGIHGVVSSVTQQICTAYEIAPPSNAECATTMYGALTLFRHAIATVSRDHAALRPLYIVLDGLDQLHPHEESLSSLWALRNLPPNIHVLLSTVPQIGQVNFIGVLLTLVTDEESSTEVTALNEKDASDVISTACAAASRTLSDGQRRAILQAYSVTRQPLHFSLMLTDALQWMSDESPGNSVAENTATFVNAKLEALEVKFGVNVVKYYVAYVTTASIGVHELELRELLSSNDDIISDMRSRFPLPDDVLSVPMSLLRSIKHALAPLMEEHLEFGKTVLAWNHSDIYAAMASRYQVIYSGIDAQCITGDATSFTLQLHEDMVNRYMPYRQSSTPGGTDGDSVAESVHVTATQHVNVGNVTMLQKLPVLLKVLLPMEGPSRIKSVAFFNLHWMMTKLHATSLRDVLQDVLSILALCRQLDYEQVFIEASMWKDIELLYLFLRVAAPAIRADVDNLPVEIVCRLRPFAGEFPSSIAALVKSAEQWLQESQKFLLPVFPCLPLPTDPLRYSMTGPTHVVGFKHGGSLAVMFSQKNGVSIWQLSTGELTYRFPVHPEQSVAGVVSGRVGEFVVVGHYSYVNRQMEIRVLSTDTGVELLQSHFAHEFEVIAMDRQDEVLVVATMMQADKTQKAYRCLLGVDVMSRDVMYTLLASDVHQDGIAHVLFLDELRASYKSLLTVGATKSKDLALWNLDSQQLEFCVDLGYVISHVRVHEENLMAVCGSADSGAILIVDLENGELCQVVEDPAYVGMTEMHLTQKARHVIIATCRNGIAIHSLDKGSIVKSVSRVSGDNSHSHIPVTFTLDAKELLLIVGCESGLVAVYNVATMRIIARLDGHTAKVNTLHCLTEGRLLSAGEDGCARLWNIDETVNSLLDSEDVERWDGIKQFDDGATDNSYGGDTEPDATVFPSNSDNISCMLLRHSGQQVVTASYTGPIKVWDVTTGMNTSV